MIQLLARGTPDETLSVALLYGLVPRVLRTVETREQGTLTVVEVDNEDVILVADWFTGPPLGPGALLYYSFSPLPIEYAYTLFRQAAGLQRRKDYDRGLDTQNPTR